MKKILLYFCVLGYCYFGPIKTLHSQSIQYLENSAQKNFVCTVPEPTRIGTPEHHDSVPYRLFLLEYGDGDYAPTLVSSHNNTTPAFQRTAFGYSYLFYDTTHRPTNISKTYNPQSTPGATESFRQPELPRDQNIQLYSLINSIRPLEKTHIICTYRNKKCVIAFFYNKDSAAFFKPITNISETFADDSSRPVKIVRNNTGQTIYTEISLPQLKERLGSASQGARNLQRAWETAYLNGKGFKNALFILSNAPDSNSNKKKNIFVTLLPPPPRSDTSRPLSGYDFNPDSITSIKAQLIPLTGQIPPGGIKQPNEANWSFIFTSLAHDPHYFRVYKACNSDTSLDSYSYSLHFSNDGLGPAYNVSAIMEIPAVANINLLKSSAITCTFAGNPITFFYLDPDTRRDRSQSATPSVPYFRIFKANRMPGSRHIIYFYFPGKHLPGTRQVGSLTNKLTAYITFTLPNKPNSGTANMAAMSTVNFGPFRESRKAFVRNFCLGVINLPNEVLMNR